MFLKDNLFSFSEKKQNKTLDQNYTNNDKLNINIRRWKQ